MSTQQFGRSRSQRYRQMSLGYGQAPSCAFLFQNTCVEHKVNIREDKFVLIPFVLYFLLLESVIYLGVTSGWLVIRASVSPYL